MLNADTVQLVLRESTIEFPDWKQIGEKLGVQLRGHITANILIEEWQVHERKMSWERLAKALEKIGGNEYELAAIRARQKRGMSVVNTV